MLTNEMHKEEHRILLIDDDFINREVIKNIFSHYAFLEAEDGLAGLHLIEAHEQNICAILLDVNMPVMGGIELLGILSERGVTKRIPVFLITAHDELEIVRGAYDKGVMDVILKPVTPFAILRRVESIIELFEARKALRETIQGQEQKLNESAAAIDELHRSNLLALSSAIEFRDVESGEHTNRIYRITKHILTHTAMGDGFSPMEIENMAIGSIMHDVGKIAISDVILNKPGRLSKEEFEIMKQHTVKGERLMLSIAKDLNHDAYRYAQDIARHHHERWDGRGYPDGLKGDEITIWSQVVSIADVYDALISPRVYKKAFTPDQAVKMILNGECGAFNPLLIDCFMKVEEDIRQWYDDDLLRQAAVVPIMSQDGSRPNGSEALQPNREVMDVLLLMTAVQNAYDMIICANLTKNSYYMIDYARFLTHCAGNDGVFDDLIVFGSQAVPESHRQAFIDHFCRENLLKAYHDGAKSVSLEHPQFADDGALHMVLTTVLLLKDERSGDILDITLSRYIDDEYAQKEQHRQVLTDALALAEQANNAKSDFLSRMSHDIRTPLNAIIGMSTIIAANIHDPEKIADCLVKISTSSKFLLNLINDVLDFSKIESGRLSLNEAHFDLRNMLREIGQVISTQAQVKKQNFQLHMDESLSSGYIGDEFRIRQILMNLLDNARKYTPEGGHVTIDTELTQQTGHHHVITFRVKDDGVGIRQEFLDHLFDPFAQDHPESAKNGVGLGLAIARNLVHMMNGELSVESEIGKGTTFTVELPLVALDLNEKISADLNVLVVDDEISVCEHTAILLHKMGVRATIAQSGYAALDLIRERLRRDPFDVVIVDWRMPEMDGIETVRCIRKIVSREVLVVVMSAYDWSEIEETARAAGVDLFLAKPVFEHNLRSALACSEKILHENAQESFPGERVLVVEDNELNQEVVKTILEMKSLTVDIASNGREAVEMFSASAPGTYLAVFMDVLMPEMDGHEATRCIRASNHPEATTIPIYAMTANAFHDDIVQAEACGMNGHIAKPIDFEQVTRILQHLVAAR